MPRLVEIGPVVLVGQTFLKIYIFSLEELCIKRLKNNDKSYGFFFFINSFLVIASSLKKSLKKIKAYQINFDKCRSDGKYVDLVRS